MNTVRNPKSVCSRIGLALLALMGFYLIGTIIISVFVVVSFPTITENPVVFWLINDIPLYVLALPAFLLIMHFIPENKTPETPRIKMTVGKYLLLLVFCLGASYLIGYITAIITELLPGLSDLLTGGAENESGLEKVMESSGLLINFIFIACIPAIGEEFVFRYMLRRKLRGAGDKVYILISGLAFGLFHMNINQFIFTAILGGVLAWIYAQTNQFWIPVSIHFALNFTTSVLLQKAADNDLTSVVSLIGVGLLAIAAIVIFFVVRRRVLATIQGPTEAGWPLSKKQQRLQPVFAAPAYGVYPQQGGYPAQQNMSAPVASTPYAYGVAPQNTSTPLYSAAHPQQQPPPTAENHAATPSSSQVPFNTLQGSNFSQVPTALSPALHPSQEPPAVSKDVSSLDTTPENSYSALFDTSDTNSLFSNDISSCLLPLSTLFTSIQPGDNWPPAASQPYPYPYPNPNPTTAPTPVYTVPPQQAPATLPYPAPATHYPQAPLYRQPPAPQQYAWQPGAAYPYACAQQPYTPYASAYNPYAANPYFSSPYGSNAIQAYPYPYPVAYPPRPYVYYQRPATIASVCFGNVGMILFICFTGLFTFLTLLL